MKLVRLLLHAYGPFTDTTLDFTGTEAEPARNLHLIYGPNEAGKSSALRAMTDLRFGIPLRSQDDFVHASSALRIAGEFLDQSGEVVGLLRRKGRGVTLSRFDAVTGQATDVDQAIESALTGGLGREEFEAMFGLNHARLRSGGELLLQGKGELGAALFEASAGTQGVAAILTQLETDAKELFNPHGRSQNARINAASKDFATHKQQWRQAQIRPAEWQALDRAQQGAITQLDDVERALENARRQEKRLIELRTVVPLLRHQDQIDTTLQPLLDLPDLPENARDTRLAAQQTLARAEQDLQEAQEEATRGLKILGTLIIEEPLLIHGDAIDRLAARLEMVERNRVELGQLDVRLVADRTALAATAERMVPGQGVATLFAAMPSEYDHVAIQQDLDTEAHLALQMESQGKQITALDRQDARDPCLPGGFPDSGLRQAMASAIRTTQPFGDLPERLEEMQMDIVTLERQLQQALADRDIADLAVLQSARPLLDAQIQAGRQSLTEIDTAQGRLRDEEQRLIGDLEMQQRRQDDLAAEGEVVTAGTLRDAREHRDAGWALLRPFYLTQTPPSAEAITRYAEPRSLPEAFEAAQGAADRQADLLRADAQRGVMYAECQTRIVHMTKRCSEIALERTTCDSDLQHWRSLWDRQLAAAQLPMLDPESLSQWQAARLQILDIAERLAQTHTQSDRYQTQLDQATETLVGVLKKVGESPQTTHLATLIEQAQSWEQATILAVADQRARDQARQTRQQEREELQQQSTRLQSQWQQHQQSIQAWHSRLFLAIGSTSETVKARLAEWDRLNRQSEALAAVERQQGQIRALLDDFASQAGHLAEALGESAPQWPEDWMLRLKNRLSHARQEQQQRVDLNRDQQRLAETQRRAAAEIAKHSQQLAALCAAAGVTTADELPHLEEKVAQKRALQRQLAEQKAQLVQASRHSEAELRQQLADQDTLTLDSALQRCQEGIVRLEQDERQARQQEETTRRALESIDSSDLAAQEREAMESAAARYRSGVRPWAQLKLAHALLQEALNRFRERAQAPMVAAASAYFVLMTGERYARLVADTVDDQPILQAERADGQRISVAAMSEGTADQLYLALRLAALELRRAAHPDLPLILDDVLMTSDDQRAAQALQALARFADGGQVLLFTHHRHLIDLAQNTLGDGVIVHYL